MEATPSSKWDHYSSVAELAARLRRRRASPVEFVAACLQRIEKLDPQLNAFITVAAESAAEAAKTAEAEIEQGKWRGFLHGIPLAVKDFYDTAGMRTTAGAEQFKHRVPAVDAADEGRGSNRRRKDKHAFAGHGNDRTPERIWTGEEPLES